MRSVKKMVRLFLLLLFILLVKNTYAQPISIPYSCGFEDDNENQNWILNYGPEGVGCKDQWIIGNGARSEGRSGLYISTDSMSATYGWGYENTVTAYRTFSVAERTRYDISFDWKNTGESGISDLYVLLLQPGDALEESDSTNALNVSPATLVYRRHVNKPNSFNNDNNEWTNFSFEESLFANTDFTLMFVWINKRLDSIPNRIGACIDNIQIASTRCPKPYDLTIEPGCDTTKLTWKGTSTSYEAEYKLQGSTNWLKLGTQSSTKTIIVNLSQGMYDFRVRSICSQDTSAYNTKSGVVVSCLGDNCLGFDFTDLYNAEIVAAYTGLFGNPRRFRNVVDYGSESMYSQHTVHRMQDEFDPNTGNKLRTVPRGSYASVRLGNWNTGREAECLEYTYTVDSLQSILLLHYAIVLEDPSHDEEEQPHFLLEILDENLDIIDPTCGGADFYADKGRNGWQDGIGMVTWKDWTMVGLHLDEYAGQTLTIRLITEDCDKSGHFGYAYFTLDCTSATLSTNTCGDAMEMLISAPDGFQYEWSNPDRPGEKWYTQEIEIPATDSTTYYCKVSFLENDSCYFELSTKIYPRFPVAEFTYEHITENCQSIIRLKNKSHIMTNYDGIPEHLDEPCDMYLWEFSNGISLNTLEPEISCRNEGDTLKVKLTAYLADCFHEDSLLIIVPPVGQTVDTVYHDMCYGEGYLFADGRQLVFDAGFHHDTVPSKLTGCDSITVLELTVHPIYEDAVVFDTICFGDIRAFAGKEYSTTDMHTIFLPSQYGCDSIVHLDLYVRDEITFDVEVTDVLDGPNSGKIEIKDVSISDYTYTINGELNGALTGLSGGLYTIILYNEYGCQSVEIEVIVFQDCLEVDVQDIPVICTDDGSFTLHYKIEKGYATTFDVIFSPEAQSAGFTNLYSQPADEEPVSIPFSSTVRPDIYEVDIRFEDLLCDSVHNLQSITVNYSSLILEQKWNDVLAIVNSRYNGGYDFTTYQWYKNGIPIDGATHSYLYVGNSELDYGAKYTVLLTRSDDGKSLFTCAMEPAFKDADTQISLYPLIISKRQQVNLTVPEPAWVSVYDSMGRKHKTHQVPAASNIGLDIPENEGYYIVIVQLENGIQESFKIAVR